MNEIYRVLDQMDRAFSGEAWHGPSLIRLLDGLSPEEASRHPIPGAHSIWNSCITSPRGRPSWTSA